MVCKTLTLPGGCDLLALAAASPQRYPALLLSAFNGAPQSRFDLLFVRGVQALTLGTDGVVRDETNAVVPGLFLDALDTAWCRHRRERVLDGLPFHGGWFVYLGYELIRQIEPRLHLPAARSVMPVALALRAPAAIIVDRVRHCTVLLAEEGEEHWLDTMAADMQAPRLDDTCPLPLTVDEEDPQHFLTGVQCIYEHLCAGDVFQVNLSRRWQASFRVPLVPAQLMRALCCSNPAPFAGLLQQPGWAIVSSSPERLIESRDKRLLTCPIAGSWPRFKGDDERARILALATHPKERAEHVMLVDLERNDLGRVCVPGSIRVTELMAVESYAHVHHMVSTIGGLALANSMPGEILAAIFPGGSITGCPKLRCMEIIAAIECEGRGAYTGALGYLDHNGDMDFNILIRTLICEGQQVSLRAGAGIVVDSVAENELDETRVKARGLLHALGVTRS